VNRRESTLWALAGSPGLMLVVVPLVALASRATSSSVVDVLNRSETSAAIALSLRTTAISILIVALIGFPLAYFIFRSRGWFARIVDIVADLPIVLPPAAAGIALCNGYAATRS